MSIIFILYICMMSTIKADCGDNKVTVCENDNVYLQCQPNEKIEITKVFYGRGNNVTCTPHWSMPNYKHGCFSIDSYDKVSARCNGNNQCTFLVSNNLFSDPCPNIFKYFEVEYKCKPVSVTICENEIYRMNCSPGTRIEVTRVFYGRANNVTCFPHWSMGNFQNGCYAQNALDVVKRKCNGLQTCDIQASYNVFSDPCPNVFKYFEIDFTCKQ